MQRYLRMLILLLLALGLLAACGGEEEETAPEPTEAAAVVEDEAADEAADEEMAEEPAEEEMAEPEETEPAEDEAAEEEMAEPEPPALTEADLDAAFAPFLDSMVAYNTIGLEDTNLALVENPDTFLLDVREIGEVEENGHIEGSVLIPLRSLAQNLNLLPAFDTPIIAYCGSGWRATIAMSALQAMGWTDVTVLKGGSFGGWVAAGYPVTEGVPPEAEVLDAAAPDAQLVARMDEMLMGIPEGWGVVTNENLNIELLENPDLILIDVRRVAEVEEKGFIDVPNAQFNVPIEEMIAMRADWPADLDAPIVVYCGSGHRSTIGMSILRSYGYTDVRSLKGGFGTWVADGFPAAGGLVALDNAYNGYLDSMVAYNTVGLEDANLALVENPDTFLLDVRQPEEAESGGHIPGAVLIPLRELGQNLNLLPSFDTPIIAYCGSGWRATIAMTALKGLGWEDVTVLKGGSFGGWVEAGFPVEEGIPPEAEVLDAAAPDPNLVSRMDAYLSSIPEGWGVLPADTLATELIEDDALVLLDVRTEGEVAEKGRIDAPFNEQMNLPLEQFVALKDEWPSDKDTPIVVYCGSGHRSTMAMSILWSYGYTNVRSLRGGFGGWAGGGFPVNAPVTLDTVYEDFLVNMQAYNTISLEDTNLALVEDPPPFLLDVREISEVEANGHIESAVVIPLRELAQNLQYLPSYDTPIIAYCGSGWRATIAMTALQAMGWTDVTVLKGGSFSGWVEAGYPVIEGMPPEPLLLEVAAPEPGILAQIDAMLTAIPEGWGVITAETLNTELIENPDLIVIDVRRAEEVAENGVILADNLIVIPIEEFVQMQEMWPEDLDAPIVVYCGSGHRSTIGMTILWSYGYTDVRSLRGGFGGWAAEGYPVAEYAAP